MRTEKVKVLKSDFLVVKNERRCSLSDLSWQEGVYI